MSSDHEEIAQEDEARDMHIPEGPITRSKARALQEVVRSLMSTHYAEQGATKILHVTTCVLRPGLEEALSKEART